MRYKVQIQYLHEPIEEGPTFDVGTGGTFIPGEIGSATIYIIPFEAKRTLRDQRSRCITPHRWDELQAPPQR